MKNKKTSRQRDPADLKNAGFFPNERAQANYLRKKGLDRPSAKSTNKKDC